MSISNNQRGRETVGLVAVPVPGMGHLIAMIELLKHLLHHSSNNFHITILTFPPTHPSPQLTSYMSSITTSIPNISFKPLIDPSLFENDGNIFSTLHLIDLHKPEVKSTISDLQASTPIAAILVDFFCTNMIDISTEMGIPFYIFFTSGAAMLGHKLYAPTIDATLPPNHNIEELHRDGIHVHIPTLSSPLPALALPSPYMDRDSEIFKWFLHHGRRFRDADGIVVNSFVELEPYAAKALEEGLCIPDHPTPPVYFVGPLVDLQLDCSSKEMECLRWLDGQPQGSVVLLCFGSLGTFSKEQAREVAVGLERSGHRFLWVLRSAPPSQSQQKDNPLPPIDPVLDDVLPDGFLERTKESGMVWPTYAPQVAILAHKAIGGFVTHCGWNSCLESMWFGVPMLAWPLYAEQHFNAYQMVEEMEVAIKLNIDRLHDNWATTDEVERGIRCLMEEGYCEQSRKVRSKALEMMEKGRRALEEGGSSFLSMRSLVRALVKDDNTKDN